MKDQEMSRDFWTFFGSGGPASRSEQDLLISPPFCVGNLTPFMKCSMKGRRR